MTFVHRSSSPSPSPGSAYVYGNLHPTHRILEVTTKEAELDLYEATLEDRMLKFGVSVDISLGMVRALVESAWADLICTDRLFSEKTFTTPNGSQVLVVVRDEGALTAYLRHFLRRVWIWACICSKTIHK